MSRLVTLIGGAGFVGRALTEVLAHAGWRIRIVSRNAAHGLRLKPLGELGQIDSVAGDVRSAASMARAVAGADAVVNFVGILKPAGGASFDAIHARGAATVARAAADGGVAQFVQVSAIGADANSASAYGRSKAAGEAAVLAAFPNAAIVRPSLIFGAEDGFTNRFAGLMALAPVVPVIAPATRFQPVYVGDVAAAIAAILERVLSGRFDLAGPEVRTMRQLNEMIADASGLKRHFIDVPDIGARLLAGLGFLPGAPLTADQYAMLQRDNVAEAGVPGLAALGVTPTPMGAVIGGWLARYRPGGRFAKA
ncbi:complex I NDUFA9 subunit family protein [Sandaracinobacteroides saxicola]|uniref:Complex I NDUFA9 subunit family protein n=1 Tax=Sandaracinobacteroides saxicola TaxID=2759707 RepID=A0A7G5IFV7_9SPHN|nr:complex I NDUFA9 subunit family protein [Sandaracinobacteroides saxicola]QMW22249.1 complex I NDUFA9 subunit family protein [Sandaracinobacteroides saxicola]